LVEGLAEMGEALLPADGGKLGGGVMGKFWGREWGRRVGSGDASGGCTIAAKAKPSHPFFPVSAMNNSTTQTRELDL
jgi:hypothetical protein